MIKDRVKIHNRFDLQLIDAKTNEVKQTAQAENVVLDKFWTDKWSSTPYLATSLVTYTRGIKMGTGTGTPSPSDTALFKDAFWRAGNVTMIDRDIKYPTSTFVGSITFPASTSYVGLLTEIGLLAHNENILISHAMLKDSEGNNITINKTDADILVVTFTLYVTISTTDDDFNLWWNAEQAAFFQGLMVNGTSTTYGPFWTGTSTPGRNDIILSSCCNPNRIYGETSPGVASASFTPSTRKYVVNGSRIGVDNHNLGYFHGIGLYNHGHYQLPNEEVFPSYTIENIDVGTGDGETTEFDCPIPMFVKNTDVLKINGTTLVRGTDYTIDNMQNAKMDHSCSPCSFAMLSENTNPIPNSANDVWNYGPFCNAGPFTIRNSTCLAWRIEEAVTFDCTGYTDPVIGKKVNCVRLKDIYFTTGGSITYADYTEGEAKMYVEYSMNGTEWTRVVEYVLPGTRFTAAQQQALDEVFMIDTIEPNYLRFGFEGIYSSSTSAFRYIFSHGIGKNNVIKAGPGGSFIGYVGAPIKFTTPPEAGATITLDVDVDRPYKNSNFVIDSSISVQF